VAETSYSRGRNAALAGLALQLVATAAAFGLGYAVGATAMFQLGWYLLGGVPLWFVTLLVFRQHELAALEKLDLEELRREKRASGGGEAIFDEEGGAGLGFMVAEARLRWMERWLIPAFGLVSVAYLVGFGLWRWTALEFGIRELGWPAMSNVPLAMVALAALMLFLFLFARYASGMGRVPEWQLLRGCGSFMLGNAVAAMALIVCLGVHLYTEAASWEHVLAYVIPVAMVLLGAETFLNFVLDIYRPRTPGAVPRACFDSRILGLISEPGGIARTLAEAINYQFGFEVSQTWLYQLLQRAALPLIAVGALSLWLLSSVIVVQPHEMAIVERFGRQLNAEAPYEPGLHWKLPWPIDRTQKYNTGQLYQIYIGAKTETEEPEEPDGSVVELWTDPKHRGVEHWNLLVVPAPRKPGGGVAEPSAAPTEPAAGQQVAEAVPVHIMRMDVVLQYKIEPTELAAYTRSVANPHDALRDIAWEEVLRFNASATPDQLLGELRSKAGRILNDRITERIKARNLGLTIDYVGLHGVHPAPDVAKAFRTVVSAEQEKAATIRQARVSENEVLSRVAGDRTKALDLVRAIDNTKAYGDALDQAEWELDDPARAAPQEIIDRLEALRPQFLELIRARWVLDRVREEHERVTAEFKLGLGGSLRQCAQAKQAVKDSEAAEQMAGAALEEALRPIRSELAQHVGQSGIDALLRTTEARIAVEFWNRRIERALLGLEGEAAVELAQAHARRWEEETRAAGEVAALANERYAYNVAPEIYTTRRYLEVLVEGVEKARKYFYGFDPEGRVVHTRIEAQEQARPDITDLPGRIEP
jgi:membrane protease subunit HflK